MTIEKTTLQKIFTVGFTAKGVVYFLIGFFAVATLVGLSKAGANGPKAIVEWIGTNPIGNILMGLVGLGLLAYSAYRIIQSLADVDDKGHDAGGLVRRMAWFISGLSYATMALFAFREIFRGGGTNNSGKEGMKQDMIAELLQLSWGQIAVGIIAAIFVIVGGYQAYRGLSNEHMKKIQDQQLSEKQESTFRLMGKIGLLARALVFGVVAYFLYRAAVLDDPDKFKGVGDSLQYLKNGWGTFALVLIGAGLLAYGSFMFIRARYEEV